MIHQKSGKIQTYVLEQLNKGEKMRKKISKGILIIIGFLSIVSCNKKPIEISQIEKDNKITILQSCEKNNALDCTKLASVYLLHKKYTGAFYFFQKACTLNEGQACASLGYMYLNGIHTSKDKVKALNILKKSCDLNNGLGCNNLATLYNNSTNNQTKTFKLLEKACNLNSGLACFNLGVAYQIGQFYTKDFKKSYNLYNKACTLKEGKACSDLGVAYMEGIKVQKNQNKAISLFRKGCSFDNGTSCLNLGVMYFKRKHLHDYTKALQLFKRACHLNNGGGCLHFGIMHENGIGTKVDTVKAFSFYDKACTLGEKQACNTSGFEIEK